MKNFNRSGAAIATAAALAFGALGATAAHADEAKIKCVGVNACKGQSACMGAKNSCKGMNACKGQGYVELTKSQCVAAQAKAAQDKSVPAAPKQSPNG